MRHGSLFSGIGGFDLAADWMGWENKFHCEWNEFGQKVLKYYWPDAELFKDIKQSDFRKYANRIDVLSGGFPCQPYSQAGKRLGKEDDRHLWPEMLRAVREIQPGYVVGENVRGLVSWNGGMVFDEVQSDLESEGYEVIPFILPACGKNAPHRRERVWFVAYSESVGKHRTKEPENSNRQSGERRGCDIDDISEISGQNGSTNAPNTQSIGVEGSGGIMQQESGAHDEEKLSVRSSAAQDWSIWPTEPALRSRDDGFSPKLPGTTISKHRNESIKAYGNAIVPQIAYEIFKAIEAYENSIRA